MRGAQGMGQDTCRSGPDKASAIGVMVGPGFVVADRSGAGVAGEGMSRPGVAGFNPQEV